jgi:hypothetical protein
MKKLQGAILVIMLAVFTVGFAAGYYAAAEQASRIVRKAHEEAQR